MANTLDPLKIGDSLVWNLQYKQSDNTPIDLTGSLIDIDAINKSDKSILFNITSQGNDTNSYLTVDAGCVQTATVGASIVASLNWKELV